MLLHQAVQHGLFRAVALVVNRGAIRRPLQAARDAAEAGGETDLATDMATDALCIGLAELTDTARPFAATHRVAVWQAPEIAHALRGVVLTSPVR